MQVPGKLWSANTEHLSMQSTRQQVYCTRVRIMLDGVQIYNCTNVHPLSLASNAIALCVCKTCPGNQDTVRQNSPPSTDVNHSLWLCCTLPCASIIVGINRCWASMFCFCQLWCCEMRYCCGSSSCARVNCNLRSTRGNLCTRIIARALHLLVHCALS